MIKCKHLIFKFIFTHVYHVWCDMCISHFTNRISLFLSWITKMFDVCLFSELRSKCVVPLCGENEMTVFLINDVKHMYQSFNLNPIKSCSDSCRVTLKEISGQSVTLLRQCGLNSNAKLQFMDKVFGNCWTSLQWMEYRTEVKHLWVCWGNFHFSTAVCLYLMDDSYNSN